MKGNAKKFLEFVSKNEAVKKELEADKSSFTGDDKAREEAFIKFAAKHGFTLTAEDLKAAQGEISEDELNAVAGGGCGSVQMTIHYMECDIIHAIF